MSVHHHGITAGSVIKRVYYAVPDHATIGDTFDQWNNAVAFAQDLAAELDSRLTASLGRWATGEAIAALVDARVRIDLRWVIQIPGGPEVDLAVMTFREVGKLRTHPPDDD